MTRSLQHPEARQPSQDRPEALWVPDALRGFPADELAALGHTPTEATYAAWSLARRGHGTDWLTRHFDLSRDVAGALVRASHQRQGVKATDTPAPAAPDVIAP
ncbi:MAG: hypothetical protein BGO38_11255 [Cellulomonas sp. 73-145]|nr:MAG: hypothetical protein BGO38_11255 [Cellulomonas sp. 73-145]